MRNRTKKILSVLLVMAVMGSMLFSVIPASAESDSASLNEAKYVKAYAEYAYGTDWYSDDENWGYAGIVADGTITTMDSRFLNNSILETSDDTIQYGFTYSAQGATVDETEISAYNLHFALRASSNDVMPYLVILTLSGETYAFGGNYTSEIWSGFENGKLLSKNAKTNAVTFFHIGNLRDELTIPFSNLNLEMLPNDDFVSTDFSLTVYINSSLETEYSFSGRLALVSALAFDELAWSAPYNVVFSNKSLNSEGTSNTAVTYHNQFSSAVSNNTGVYTYSNLIQMTISDLPNSGTVASLGLNDYRAATATYPMVCMEMNKGSSSALPTGTGTIRGVSLGILNCNGMLTMFARNSTDIIPLGLSPSSTSFSLRLDWIQLLNDNSSETGTVDVYVNDVYRGTLTGCKGVGRSSNPRNIYVDYYPSTTAGSSEGEAKPCTATVSQWTVSSCGDLRIPRDSADVTATTSGRLALTGWTQNTTTSTVSATTEAKQAAASAFVLKFGISNLITSGDTTQYFYKNTMWLTASALPNIEDLAINYTPNQATTTPALIFVLTPANNVSGNTSYSSQNTMIAIVNRNGSLFAAANGSSDEVALGVGLETPFFLELGYQARKMVSVSVNGTEKGTLTGYNNTSNYANARTVAARIHPSTDGSINASIKDWKITVPTALQVRMKSLISADALLSAGASHYTPIPYGYQTTAVTDGHYNARIIATVDADWVTNKDLAAVGFYITASYTDAESNVTNGTQKDYFFYSVYSSIIAAGDTINAPAGTYFVICPILNIPATGSLTITYQPYARLKNDTIYAEGTAFTVTFANGSISQ